MCVLSCKSGARLKENLSQKGLLESKAGGTECQPIRLAGGVYLQIPQDTLVEAPMACERQMEALLATVSRHKFTSTGDFAAPGKVSSKRPPMDAFLRFRFLTCFYADACCVA